MIEVVGVMKTVLGMSPSLALLVVIIWFGKTRMVAYDKHLLDCDEKRIKAAVETQSVVLMQESICEMSSKVDSIGSKVDHLAGQVSVALTRVR